MRWKRLCAVIFLCRISIILATLDFKELREVNYDVDIKVRPFALDVVELRPDSKIETVLEAIDQATLKESGEIITLASETGQKFQCRLPEPVPQVPDDPRKSATAQNLSRDLVHEVVGAGFYINQCLRRTVQWWTYELCYGKQVQQYHLEGKDVVGAILSLGAFEASLNLPTFVPRTGKPLYFEQIYSGGTVCDVNGKERLTRVRYFCDEDLSSSEAIIDSVDEERSCEYLISVSVGALCSLKAFLPTDRPTKPTTVECRPLLDDNDVRAAISAEIELKRKQAKAQIEAQKALLKAQSLQRRRHARKSLTLHSLGEAVNAALDARLEMKYRRAMQTVMTNQAIVDSTEKETALAQALNIVFDDLYQYAISYATESDEDRGNFYWYMTDRLWPKHEYPYPIAYVRKANERYAFSKLPSIFGGGDDTSDILTALNLDTAIGDAEMYKSFEKRIFALMMNGKDLDRNKLLTKIWTELVESVDDIKDYVAKDGSYDEAEQDELIEQHIQEMYEELSAAYDRAYLKFIRTKPTQTISTSGDPSTKTPEKAKIELQIAAIGINQEMFQSDSTKKKSLLEIVESNNLQNQLKKFESALEMKLKESGMDFAGKEIKVKIVSGLNELDGQMLSMLRGSGLDEDKVARLLQSAFEGQQEIVAAEKKHSDLEEAYKYRANSPTASTGDEQSDENSRSRTRPMEFAY